MLGRRTIVAAIAALLAGGATALATNFGAGGGIYFTDNSSVSFYYQGLGAGFADALTWVRGFELAPTDLSHSSSGSHSAADVAVYDADYGDSGWWGIATCITPITSSTCDHHHVEFNIDHSPGGDGWSVTEMRSLACEEIAHTVGLRHRYVAGTCMSQAWSETHLNTHDDAHINAQY